MKTEEKTEKNLEVVEFLVFEAMGSLIGIDSEHITRITGLKEAKEEGAEFEWFHEKIPFGKHDVDYLDPRVIFIKDGGSPKGLVIDRPRDFVTVPVGMIRPMPAFVGQSKGASPFWGATVIDEEVVILADFFKLMDSDVGN
jgi:chemotaxis signal transduction protein